MRIEYLQEFVTIARLKSFSLAAEYLYLSQSSLSKHIDSLEKELGYLLFDRNRRNVALSAKGEKVLAYAAEICSLGEKIRLAAVEDAGEGETELSIACIPVMAQFGFSDIIAAFEKKYPHIRVSPREYEGGEILSVLQSGECELGFHRIFHDYERKILESIPLAIDTIVVVVPVSHPLAGESSVRVSDLSGERFLMMDSSTNLLDVFSDVCTKAGFTPQIVFTGHRPDTIMAYVRSGRGIALFMEKPARYFADGSVRILPLLPKIISPVYLTRKKSESLSQPGRLFWNFTQEAIKP